MRPTLLSSFVKGALCIFTCACIALFIGISSRWTGGRRAPDTTHSSRAAHNGNPRAGNIPLQQDVRPEAHVRSSSPVRKSAHAQAHSAAPSKCGNNRSASVLGEAAVFYITEPVPPVIPHVVYATGPAIGRTAWAALVEQNRVMLPPDTTFEYFTDDEMDESFRNLSGILTTEGVVDDAYGAYMTLVPFAYRSDLWRAAIVWVNGGIYLDNKVLLLHHYSSWADVTTGRLSICDDMPPAMSHGAAGSSTNRTVGKACAVLVAAPRDPGLAAVLRLAIANVKAKFMGAGQDHGPLAIVSPIAYARALQTFDVHTVCQWHAVRCWTRTVDALGVFSLDAKLRAVTKTCTTCNDYFQLWKSRKVYCSQLSQHDRATITHRCPPADR